MYIVYVGQIKDNSDSHCILFYQKAAIITECFYTVCQNITSIQTTTMLMKWCLIYNRRAPELKNASKQRHSSCSIARGRARVNVRVRGHIDAIVHRYISVWTEHNVRHFITSMMYTKSKPVTISLTHSTTLEYSHKHLCTQFNLY